MTPLSRFIAASGLTNLADGVAVVAWAWLASLLTRDPMLIALVPVALRLPWFLCALPAGLAADRMDRRRLILAMDVVRAAAFAAVGVAEVFRDNAAQTMLPALVPPGQLERANGRLWSVELVGNSMAGPALGAALIGLSLPLPFAANAGAYALAVLLLLGLRGQFAPPPAAAPRDWRRELAEGWAFLRGSALLRTLAVTTGGWNLLHQLTAVALVLHAQENFGLPAAAYGLMLAAAAVGGILGALAGEAVVRRLGPGRTAQWMLAVSAPGFVAMALAPGPVSMAVALAVFEAAGMAWNIVSVSYRQRAIPSGLLGRVNSLYRLLAWGMMPLGLALSGLVLRGAEAVMPRGPALTVPFWVAAAGMAWLTWAVWRRLGSGFAPAPAAA